MGQGAGEGKVQMNGTSIKGLWGEVGRGRIAQVESKTFALMQFATVATNGKFSTRAAAEERGREREGFPLNCSRQGVKIYLPLI